MRKTTFLDNVMEFFAGVFFNLYLRFAGMTEDEFLAEHEREAMGRLLESMSPNNYCQCSTVVIRDGRCIKCGRVYRSETHL
jgi:hypothetical protein